ncbi:MAG: DUF4136 domain-containing protein [Pseudomonadota bacterium]
MKRLVAHLLLATSALLLASGCSTMRAVDTDVTSFARWTPAAPARGAAYRFERLPSQQALAPGAELSQDQIEAMARQALDKAGLVNNPGNPAFNVQVSATTRLIERGPYDSGFFGRPGVSIGAGTGGGFFGLSLPIGGFERPLYQRELSIVMRDARSNSVVYETRASQNDIWGDAQVIFPVMLDAALQGFPNPPPGRRRVHIEVPR